MLNKLKCLRCFHSWYQRTPVDPVVCPKCKTPYWNKPKNKEVQQNGSENKLREGERNFYNQ